MSGGTVPPPDHDQPTPFGKLKATGPWRRLRQWWVRHHDVAIRDGVGKGLRFKAGYNPAYADGKNERPVQEALATHLRPGDVFYDIGANIGFFTVIGARLVEAGGQVIAFEPVPENAAAVRHNCALNGFGNVRVLETAVSDHVGTGELKLAKYGGGSSLTEVPPDDFKGVITVPATTVDAIVAQGDVPPPALVKIDVEGAEIDVLRGMRDTLQRIRPIIIYELDDSDPESLAKKSTSCEQFLSAAGYEINKLQNSYPEIDWLVNHYVALPIKG